MASSAGNYIKMILILTVFHLIFSPTSQKAKFRKKKSYSNKFFHNFHLSESSLTCPGLGASGLRHIFYVFHCRALYKKLS
jgi:hypothetical protein